MSQYRRGNSDSAPTLRKTEGRELKQLGCDGYEGHKEWMNVRKEGEQEEGVVLVSEEGWRSG